jgi:predicted phosphodiesterase
MQGLFNDELNQVSLKDIDYMTSHLPAVAYPDPAGVLFYGDPHGKWAPLTDAVLLHRPAAVVILGDCGLDEPLRQKLAAIWDLVPVWKWIIGNHDVDSLKEYEFLVDSYPEGDLSGRSAQLDGHMVAGLGGIYRSQIWYPKLGGLSDEPPKFRTRQDMIKVTARADRIKGGLPRSSRAAIFPEDHEQLRKIRADVLVCHEAPTSEKYGFASIDALAREMRVGLVVHGHHHRSYEGQTEDGIPVRGLGIAEPWLWPGANIVE